MYNLISAPALVQQVKQNQWQDPHLRGIWIRIQNGEQFEDWRIREDGALYFRNRLAVPKAGEIKKMILHEAHKSRYAIHPGSTKMYQDLKRQYWWRGMKRDVREYVSECVTCLRVKAEHQKPAGELQPLPVPEWKWEHITMDFLMGLPRTELRHDAIWVVVDRLTKSAHFIPFRATYSRKVLSELYLEHIVRLHGVPLSITSDRDTRFNARYWRSFQEAMGTELNFSTAFHPQTDGQSERVIQILEDMLRACILDFGGNWKKYLHLAEFAYNNSYQASIGMAPFEALYGRPCRSPVCWLEPEDRLTTGPDVIQENNEKIAVIRERLLTAQSRQKSYADRRRRPLEFQEGDFVLLKVSPRKGVTRFGVKGKLAPRYVGPFPIVQRVGVVAYRLALPPELSHVHDVFHVSMLRKCQPEPEAVVQWFDVPIQYDASYEEAPVQILDRKMKSLRHREIPLVKVLWQHHGVEEATWELETTMQERYPHLFAL